VRCRGFRGRHDQEDEIDGGAVGGTEVDRMRKDPDRRDDVGKPRQLAVGDRHAPAQTRAPDFLALQKPRRQGAGVLDDARSGEPRGQLLEHLLARLAREVAEDEPRIDQRRMPLDRSSALPSADHHSGTISSRSPSRRR
jgi:hypothetical protein